MNISRLSWLLMICVALMLSAACSTPAPAPVQTGFAAFAAQPATVSPTASFEAVATYLPPDTAFVANIDVKSSMSFYKAFGIVPEDWDSASMDNDIRAFVVDRLGADLTKTEWVTVAWAPPERFYVFAYGDLGPLRGQTKNTAAGMTFHSAKERDFHISKTSTPKLHMILVGPGASEDSLAWRTNGTKESLQTSTQGKLLRNVLKDTKPAYLTVAFQATHPMIAEVLGEVPMELPNSMSYTIHQDSARLVMHGSPNSLNGLVKLLKDQSAEFKNELAREMKTLPEKDFAEGLMTIVGYHMIDPVTTQFTPQVQGDMMTLDMTPTAGIVMLYGATIGAAMFPMMMMGGGMGGSMMEPAIVPPMREVPSPKAY